MEIFIKSVVGHGSNIRCKKMSYLKIYSKSEGGMGAMPPPPPFSAVHDKIQLLLVCSAEVSFQLDFAPWRFRQKEGKTNMANYRAGQLDKQTHFNMEEVVKDGLLNGR